MNDSPAPENDGAESQDSLTLKMKIHELERELEAHRAQAISLWEQLLSLQGQLSAMQGSPAYGLALRLNKYRPVRGVLRVLRTLRPGRAQTQSPLPVSAEPPANLLKPTISGIAAERLGIGEKPLDANRLTDAIRSIIGTQSFALSISHDSYHIFTGGIQVFIIDEIREFESVGVSHIHVCPSERSNSFVDYPVDVLISLNGKPLAMARATDFIEAIKTLAKPQDACRSIVIHHAINWNVAQLGELVQAAGPAPKFFWVHDYYSICRSYNLLRNDRLFCNAPPVDSSMCQTCKYGATRAGHMKIFTDLLHAWNAKIFAPSERAAEIWRRAHPELADQLSVQPIYHLEDTTRENPRSLVGARKIKIAYPGVSFAFKGWNHWRDLVSVLADHPSYELVHLGQKTDELGEIAFPERFRKVKSGPGNHRALPEAFGEEEIDIVFYTPTWAETFSLIAYESNGMGCWTLTTEESGNVAVYIRTTGAGRVFASMPDLMAYLLRVEEVRRDLEEFRRKKPILANLKFNREIVRKLYLGGVSDVGS